MTSESRQSRVTGKARTESELYAASLATVRNKATNLADTIRRMQRDGRNGGDDFLAAQKGFHAAVEDARGRGAPELAIRRAVALAGNRPDRARALEAYARG